VVGILFTGCQKLGVKTQSEKVDRNEKTGHGSAIFSSIFGAYGIPLISLASVQSAPPPPCAAIAAAAASLRRFLVSAALVLLSLSRSALILSASSIDTIRPRIERHHLGTS
jgi:hypothetical protein